MLVYQRVGDVLLPCVTKPEASDFLPSLPSLDDKHQHVLLRGARRWVVSPGFFTILVGFHFSFSLGVTMILTIMVINGFP